MASKIKHYTSVEKKIFLDVLKEYKDVIEAKKSESSTLRETAAAWTEIGRKYNNSFQINDDRTVTQLKKLWTNLKQSQRNALTQERQAAMTTGDGPQAPSVEIDPDIAMIAPHLFIMAPNKFTSNTLPNHEKDYLIEIAAEEDDEDEGDIEYLDVALLEEPDVVRASENESSHPGTSSSSSQAVELGTPTQVRKKLRVAEKRHRTCTESSGQLSGDWIKRDTLKMQRFAGLRDRDDELFRVKYHHELKVAKVKECHLNVVNKMREEHLAKIHDLELRKATAKAELAEFQLLREKK